MEKIISPLKSNDINDISAPFNLSLSLSLLFFANPNLRPFAVRAQTNPPAQRQCQCQCRRNLQVNPYPSIPPAAIIIAIASLEQTVLIAPFSQTHTHTNIRTIQIRRPNFKLQHKYQLERNKSPKEFLSFADLSFAFESERERLIRAQNVHLTTLKLGPKQI